MRKVIVSLKCIPSGDCYVAQGVEAEEDDPMNLRNAITELMMKATAHHDLFEKMEIEVWPEGR